MSDGAENKKKNVGEEGAGADGMVDSAICSSDTVVDGALINLSEHVGTATVAGVGATVVASHYVDGAAIGGVPSMTATDISADLRGGIEDRRDEVLSVATATVADDSVGVGERQTGWRREIFDALRSGNGFGAMTKFLLEDGDYDPDKPDNQRSFFWTKMFGETHPNNCPDESLYNAVHYFDEIVRELGLEDAPLLKDPEVREDLRGRLHEFIQYVDSKLDSVATRVKGSEGCSNFSKDWRCNLKYACYCAFFVHYSEKRKGELDDDDKPKDYAYHPVRSAFDNLVPRVRFFCEPTIIADIFHDVPENWKKGFLGMLNASKRGGIGLGDFGRKSRRLEDIQDELEREKGDVFMGWFKGLCQVFDTVSGRNLEEAGMNGEGRKVDTMAYLSRIVGIGNLVDILTKTSDGRARAIVDMLSKICRYSGVARFSASRAFLIKMTDRLDNVASLTSLMKRGSKMGGPSEERVSEIGLETIYFFIALAIALKAWNIVDWLYDYMVFSDPEEREKRIDLRRRSDSRVERGGESIVLKTRFRDEFKKALGARMKDSSISEGEDYVLEFRPVGVRYERPEAALAAMDRGSYARHFQHFLIFRCGKKDPAMLVAASEVFKRLFPKPLSDEVLTRGEFGSVLGEKLSNNRMGVSDDENGYSDTYGVGVWSVFNGPEDLSEKILGDVNRGYFYRDLDSDTEGVGTPARAARARVLALLNGIEPFVRLLTEQYSLVDCLRRGMCSSVDDAREGVRRDVLGVDLPGFGKASFNCPSESGSNPSGIDVGGIYKIEKIIGKLVMTMFMEKPVTVGVSVNGEYSAEVQLPAEHTDFNSALVFGATWALGREISQVEEAEVDGKKKINIIVDLSRPFDPARFDRQTGFVDELLTRYQSTLLLDKYQGLRGEVFVPGYDESQAGSRAVAKPDEGLGGDPSDDSQV